MNEQYSREGILGGMQTKYIGRTVHYYDSTDSTNVRAGELAAHGHLVVADTQTAGKGRRGRSWESPAGKNIYFSHSYLRPYMPSWCLTLRHRFYILLLPSQSLLTPIRPNGHTFHTLSDGRIPNYFRHTLSTYRSSS